MAATIKLPKQIEPKDHVVALIYVKKKEKNEERRMSTFTETIDTMNEWDKIIEDNSIDLYSL